MFNKENIKKLFFIIINITFLMILITKMLSHFDLTDESQKFIKLYYFVVEDKYFVYDYNIHQAYFFILYPVLKLIYLLNQEILINNFIIINKSFYLLTLIGIFYYLFFKLKKLIRKLKKVAQNIKITFRNEEKNYLYNVLKVWGR